jgi:hypothetical protein
MCKRIFAILILALFGCSEHEKPAPESPAPSIPQYTFTITSQQTGKDVVNGKLLKGYALIAENLSKDQIRQATDAILRDITAKNVGTEWIIVSFAESQQKADGSIWLANGVYKEGAFNIELSRRGASGAPKPNSEDYAIYHTIQGKEADYMNGKIKSMKTVFRQVATAHKTTYDRVQKAYDAVCAYEFNAPLPSKDPW